MRRGFSPLQIGEGLSSPRRLRGAAGRVSFQSPSDRGGPFKHPQRIALRSHPKFQSPSDRGGPFKWTEAPPIVIVLVCFSPLQIGEGLSRAMRANCACRTGLFQSPSDRGGPFKPAQSNQKHKTAVVSVPFRSGRAFQGYSGFMRTSFPTACFSPLQIGEGLSSGTRESNGGTC